MCVIIYKKPSIDLNLETLSLAINQNPDGLGVAYRKQNKWQIVKYMYPSDKQLKNLIEELKGLEAVIHCRIATSGGINIRNCQPIFFNNNKMVLFHNGVISSLNGINKTKSDTKLLTMLLEHERINIKDTLFSISEKTSNKFVLIDDKDTVTLYGDYKEYKGLLCSNLYFLPQPKPKVYPTNNINKDVNNWFHNDCYLFKNDFNNFNEDI